MRKKFKTVGYLVVRNVGTINMFSDKLMWFFFRLVKVIKLILNAKQ